MFIYKWVIYTIATLNNKMVNPIKSPLDSIQFLFNDQ